MADALITTTVVVVRVAGPQAKGILRAPKPTPVRMPKPPAPPAAAAAEAAGAAEAESAAAKAARVQARKALENEMRMARRAVGELESQVRPLREAEGRVQAELERIGGGEPFEDFIEQAGTKLGKTKEVPHVRPARIAAELETIANDANQPENVRARAREHLQSLNVSDAEARQLRKLSDLEKKLRSAESSAASAKERLGF
ncbi:MAG TPA: hypothetical protein VIS99_04290 [Terrimicrobiaceae bacterium]